MIKITLTLVLFSLFTGTLYINNAFAGPGRAAYFRRVRQVTKAKLDLVKQNITNKALYAFSTQYKMENIENIWLSAGPAATEERFYFNINFDYQLDQYSCLSYTEDFKLENGPDWSTASLSILSCDKEPRTDILHMLKIKDQ